MKTLERMNKTKAAVAWAWVYPSGWIMISSLVGFRKKLGTKPGPGFTARRMIVAELPKPAKKRRAGK